MSSLISENLLKIFQQGVVIPAIPLALDRNRQFCERRQRALIRYYLDAGAGGIAAGVHTTQFNIRERKLFQPVMALVSHEIDVWVKAHGRPVIKIGGICGAIPQALDEAKFLALNGYHAGLLSLAALRDEPLEHLVAHAKKVAEVIPLVGFYLQPAVGGRVLPYEFWRTFLEIDRVIGIKIAPFNRYQTLDVVRALAESGREGEVTLYTGNDDHIVMDLLTPFVFRESQEGKQKTIRIRGGLLGQWSVWTKKAVEMLTDIHRLVDSGQTIPPSFFSLSQALTDANGAIFDATHAFAGCIPGIHEVLRRQGLLEGDWCLDPEEKLSSGQIEEIDRVYRSYPELNDDAFIGVHLSEWLS